MILLLSVCSIGFLIYGALVVSGIYTPISSKILVEDEERAKWCHTEGVTKMLWGLDLAFFVMYRCSVFPAVLWLAADALGAGSGILCHVPDGGYYHHGI